MSCIHAVVSPLYRDNKCWAVLDSARLSFKLSPFTDWSLREVEKEKRKSWKKTDKKTRDYRGRVNSSCSISAVAMDTNPAWIHIIEWFITVSAGVHWCFLYSRGFRVEVSSWSSGGFTRSDSVLHPARDHCFVGDYQQVWNWAWRRMQARVHAASWIDRDLQQTWQFLSPSGSRSCKRMSSRLTLPQLFIFITTTQ